MICLYFHHPFHFFFYNILFFVLKDFSALSYQSHILLATLMGKIIFLVNIRNRESSIDGSHICVSSFYIASLGIESFSKLGDSIYFEEEGIVPGIYIIQYISSSFDWSSGKILLDMKVEPVVSWDNRLHVTVKISSKEVCVSI